MTPAPGIRTARLWLRPLRRADIPAMVALIGDLEVAKWLTVVPHPYTGAEGEAFLDHCDKTGEPVFAIIAPEGFAGVVDAAGELGYWLGQPFHGRGYMTEAAGAVVDARFGKGESEIRSGYFEGNTASRNVLVKLGFVPTHREQVEARALRREVTLQKVILTRKAWEARRGH